MDRMNGSCELGHEMKADVAGVPEPLRLARAIGAWWAVLCLAAGICIGGCKQPSGVSSGAISQPTSSEGKISESPLLGDLAFEVGFNWGSGQDVETDIPHVLSSLGWKWGSFNFADDKTPRTTMRNWVETEDGRRRLNAAYYLKGEGQKSEIEIAHVSVGRLPESSGHVKINLRAKVLSRLTLDDALAGPLTDARSKEVVSGPPYIFPPGDYSFVAQVHDRAAASNPSGQ